ncbi:hypothetical protein [cyanobacterium endosymbiont of Rhopalodia gibberula]|nr:hypothetical protein [cyanobacterium endosymbiont of Rhopalodia gibberula]
MDVYFNALESVFNNDEYTSIPLHNYLRQPQRLVEAITNPKLYRTHL